MRASFLIKTGLYQFNCTDSEIRWWSFCVSRHNGPALCSAVVNACCVDILILPWLTGDQDSPSTLGGLALATEPAQEANVSLFYQGVLPKYAVTAWVVPQDTLCKGGKQILGAFWWFRWCCVKTNHCTAGAGRAGSLPPERWDITFHGCICGDRGWHEFYALIMQWMSLHDSVLHQDHCTGRDWRVIRVLNFPRGLCTWKLCKSLVPKQCQSNGTIQTFHSRKLTSLSLFGDVFFPKGFSRVPENLQTCASTFWHLCRI